MPHFSNVAEKEDQKASKVTIAKEHLGRFNHDENKLLNCFVTGDEMWVHCAEPETKAQSKQWKRAGSQPPKKIKLFSCQTVDLRLLDIIQN